MTLPELALAVLVLLVTPGPTNVLLALAGAERGWRAALPLTAAAVAGYLTAVLPLLVIGQALLGSAPVLRTLISLAAAGWVLWLAVSMWRPPVAGVRAALVDGKRVYVSTVLNPKTLIFGLVLLPAQGAVLLGHLALFGTGIVVAAAGWAALGAAVAQPGGLPHWLRRSAALWLGALALWLAARGAGVVA